MLTPADGADLALLGADIEKLIAGASMAAASAADEPRLNNRTTEDHRVSGRR
jgi:hypothetical protein